MKDYNPHKKSLQILERGWEHITGVSYKVSTRWLFYRLLQDGLYKSKEDYRNQFIPLFAEARRNFFNGWRPDTLSDDTREMILRAKGYRNVEEWAKAYSGGFTCELDHWYGQSHFVIVMYEAKAMTAQFEHYARAVDLVPFGGNPSIPYKWEIAKHIESMSAKYEIPVVILYFGDLDKAGMMIPEAAIRDIREWCDVDFDFIRAGLNPGDEIRFGMPENFEKPGTYQWEALDDNAAKDLITGAISKYMDSGALEGLREQEREAEDAFEEYVEGFYESFIQRQT